MSHVLNILAEASTDSIRTEQYQGRDFLVVPVVALVEGVLHSANAENPELALAEEFGRYPASWNGRPIVMNHPKVDNNYVSANSPQVLEEWSFGMTFNSIMDGDKLKTEAWLDLDKINSSDTEYGLEMQSTVERIQSGQMVEISTGLFASVESSEGMHNNNAYSGVWRSVAPDHLAFLSEGVLGACSIDQGCGVPRLNMLQRAEPLKNNCSCGGHTMPATQTDTTTTSTNTVRTNAERASKMETRINTLLINELPEDLTFEDARKMVKNSFESASIDLYHIYAMTASTVVYELWDTCKLYQRSYSITDNSATLSDDAVEVNLMTKIVPVSGNLPVTANSSYSDSTDDDDENPRSSAGDDEDEPTPEEETDMSTQSETTAETNTAPAGEVSTQTTTDNTDGAGAVAVNTTTEAPLTVNAYLDGAPAELREVLESGLRMHNQRKAELVDSLKSNSRCDFSEDELNSMSMTVLERTAKLAQVPSYAGQTGPRTNATATTTSDQNSVPKPLEAFPRKAANSTQAA